MMRLHGHVHKAHQILAKQLAIEQGHDAFHVPLTFKALHALVHGRARQAQAPRQLGLSKTCIALQL